MPGAARLIVQPGLPAARFARTSSALSDLPPIAHSPLGVSVITVWVAERSQDKTNFSGIATGYNADMAKAQKVMVSIPDDLLLRIDREANERGTTRSGFLQEAARRELGWPDPAAIDAALARARAALDGLCGFEAAALIRAEREGRDERDRRR